MSTNATFLLVLLGSAICAQALLSGKPSGLFGAPFFQLQQSTTTAGPDDFVRINTAVKVAQRGPIRVIAMDRTDTENQKLQKNAMNSQMWQGLAKAFREADADPSTTLIVLQGQKDTFCGGADLSEFGPYIDSEPELKAYVKRAMNELRNFTAALIDNKKLIVALVEGNAVGIGSSMLPHADFVFASDNANFTTPFAMLGMVPECGSTFTFPKIMGYARASSMQYANQGLTAAQAFTYGLVTKVVGGNNFQSDAMNIVNTILQSAAKPMLQAKQLVRGPEREMLHQVSQNEISVLEPLLSTQPTAGIIRKIIGK